MRITTIRPRRWAAAAVGVAAVATVGLVAAATDSAPARTTVKDHSAVTASPIKHVVVIFDENVSFDHYFATYPHAANTDGTKFVATTSTPRANTLQNAGLLTSNPNLYAPTRLTPARP